MIEEVIRMMLEIINSCLSNSLHHNPNLVYALLYKRELFEQFRTHPSFQDIMQNLETVSERERHMIECSHAHTDGHCSYTRTHPIPMNLNSNMNPKLFIEKQRAIYNL